ncbi:MAG: hypothetical protein ACFB0D_22605 [Phormidesmis sp.]
MAEPRNDYDSPWKEVLEAYFEECMAFFFADVHRDIDWSKGYEFLEKELQQIVREAEIGRRLADKLVKVWKKTGEQVWVLVHIEVQSQAKKAFAEQMYTYNYRLRDRFKRPVASFAILSDDNPKWHPQQFSDSIWDCSIEFKFRTTKLLDYRQQSSVLLDSRNPFAIVVVAHLKTLETNRDTLSRKQWKLKLIKLLYQKGYQREDVVRLFRFIDWILVLPAYLEKSVWQDILKHQEDLKMPYMMSFERAAKAEGREEGREEGLIEGICSAIELGLELKFGDKGLDLAPQFTKNADVEILKQLKADLRSELSLAELEAKYGTQLETQNDND